MRSIVLLLAVLLATVMVDAGKHHRRHQKTSAMKHQEDIPDFPSSPGGNYPGIPGGPEDSDDPDGPQDPAASGDVPDNDFPAPSVPERKSLSRRLRANLEEARRESRMHVH